MDKDIKLNGTTNPIPEEENDVEQDPKLLSRRNLLKLGVGALGTLALLEMGGAGLLYLQARSLEGEFGGVITAGEIDGFTPGSVTEFSNNHFFLIRSPDGGFLAVHNRCTHLGCTVNWVPAENSFLCPCHAAAFDFYGNFEGPPVPRPLDTFEVQFDDTLVMVDTSLAQHRERFEPEQLAYAPPGRTAQSSP